MKKISLIFLFLLPLYSAFAQKQGYELIDSLKSRLKFAQEDTSKVRLLGKLSFQYFKFDTDLGIYYAEQAIALSEKLHWTLGLAFSYNYLATNYAVKGNYPKALEYFNKSLGKYTETGDKQGIAYLTNNLGNLYRIQKNFTKAIEYFGRSTAINKDLGNDADLAKNYNNLGSVYSALLDYSKSNDYFYKGIEICKKTNNLELLAQFLINIAENKMDMRDYCGAIESGVEAIRISEKLNITYDRAVYNRYLGEIYLRLAGENINGINSCQFYTGDKHKNLLSAKEYLITSIGLMEKINDLQILSESALLLSRVYEQLGDTRNALRYYKMYSDDKDSVFSKDNSIKMANIEKEQEVALRDKQIKIQTLEIDKKNSQIIAQIVIFVLILLLVTLIPYFYYKRKSEKALRESEERFRNLYEDASVGLYRTTPDGKVLLANRALINMLGYTSFEEISALDLNQNGFETQEARREFVEQIEKYGAVEDLEAKWIRLGGEMIIVKERAKAVHDTNGNTLYYDGTVEDITARKRAEEDLRSSLKEKEILLKEVHHRVKNNMQIISSLLDLQAYLIEDRKMWEVFKDSQNRIQAMALVHELIYRSPDFSSINIKNYFSGLIEHLARSYITKKDQIRIDFDIDLIQMSLDRIIPVGLIVNEVISNSLKHAFPGGRPGRISFSLKLDKDNKCILILSDDGIGMQSRANTEEPKTLGLSLISSLSDQINGQMETSSSEKGTEYKIIFGLV